MSAVALSEISPVEPAHQLVERQTRIAPSETALIFGDDHISFGTLDSRANQIARFLRKRGAGPETVVGLCFERSADAIVIILGVLKAGAAYLMLDPSWPVERLRLMVTDAAPVLVCATKQSASAVDAAWPVVWLEDAASDFVAESAQPVENQAGLDHMAAITFTSGSTGRPKGVIHTHRSLTTYMPRFERGDVCCLNSPLSFGFSFSRVFAPLAQGVPVVVLAARRDEPSDLAAAIEKFGITNIALVPSLLRALLDGGKEMFRILTKLRRITVAGAALAPDLVETCWRELPGLRILYGFGASETGGSTLWELNRSQPFHSQCIGYPLPHTEAYILDENLNPVPLGECGELCIGGVHLAREYLNRPELTAERFIRNPFSAAPGSRLFRTRDIARFLPDGRIELAGRADLQVKVRGFRVEVEEIEAALTRLPALKEACVAPQDFGGETRLIAYVVGKPEENPRVERLRSSLAAVLPDYMVPAVWVVTDALPLNANGKIDRKSLPAALTLRPDMDTPFQRPQTALEREIAEIWGRALGLDAVGVHDSFFDLGGDSIQAVQIVNRIWDSHRVEIPIRFLFEHPTIADICEEIAASTPPEPSGQHSEAHAS